MKAEEERRKIQEETEKMKRHEELLKVGNLKLKVCVLVVFWCNLNLCIDFFYNNIFIIRASDFAEK